MPTLLTAQQMRPAAMEAKNNHGDGRSAGRRRRPRRDPCALPIDSESESKDEPPPLLPRINSNDEDDSDSESDSDSDSDDEDDIHAQTNLPVNTSRIPTSAKRGVRSGAASAQLGNTNTTKPGPLWRELRSFGLEVAGFSKSWQRVSERTNNERFSASFGVSAKTLEAVFIDLKKKDPTLKESDFLLAMDTLKLYLTEHNMAGRWGCHEQSYRAKWKEVVAAIAALHSEKIKFDPSDFPEDQIFLLSVDGVNFSINEPRVKNPGSHWYDHKTHSAGVSYLVAMDVRKSRICWIDGPRPGEYFVFHPALLSLLHNICNFSSLIPSSVLSFISASASESVTFNGGRKKDKKKDPNCLANKIPEGKKVLADSGLKESEKASTRMPGNSHKMKHFRSRAQGRQESLFKRFKDFGILRQRFRHGYELHKMVLLAVAVIVQYDMENGHPLFDV